MYTASVEGIDEVAQLEHADVVPLEAIAVAAAAVAGVVVGTVVVEERVFAVAAQLVIRDVV